jgi:hypothetical protein
MGVGTEQMFQQTRYTVDDPRFIPCRDKIFSLLQNIQTGSGGHSASISRVLGVLSMGVKQLGCEVTTHFHIILRPRMSVATPLLPLYVLMLWITTTLLFFSYTLFFTVIYDEFCKTLSYTSVFHNCK